MSISVRIEPRGRLVLIQTIDVVGAGDWRRAIAQLVTSAGFRTGIPIVVDRRQEGFGGRSTPALAELPNHLAVELAPSKCAMIVDRSKIDGEPSGWVAPQFRAHPDAEIEAFVGTEAAIHWLLGESGWDILSELCVWAIQSGAADRHRLKVAERRTESA